MENHNILPSEGLLHLSSHLTKYEQIQLLSAQLAELKILLSAAQEEISMLTDERDEVVAAIRRWSKADPDERRELLFDAANQDLHTEIKVLRTENKRLKREVIILTSENTELPGPTRMRA